MSLSCQCGGNFVILIKSNSKPGPQKPTKQIKIMYCIKSCLKKNVPNPRPVHPLSFCVDILGRVGLYRCVEHQQGEVRISMQMKNNVTALAGLKRPSVFISFSEMNKWLVFLPVCCLGSCDKPSINCFISKADWTRGYLFQMFFSFFNAFTQMIAMPEKLFMGHLSHSCVCNISVTPWCNSF